MRVTDICPYSNVSNLIVMTCSYCDLEIKIITKSSDDPMINYIMSEHSKTADCKAIYRDKKIGDIIE